MPYLGNRPDNIVIRNAQQEFNYTATSSQTTFTGLDSNNNTLAYNPGNVEVFFNGARLEEADFTATNGTSIVLASAAATNDLLSVVATDVFEATDTVSKTNGGTFSNNIGVSGLLTANNITTTGYIRGPSSFTIDPSSHGDNTGTVVIAGDLTVNGTTTTVNSNTVNIGDNILVLNSDEAGTPSQNAGIEVERGNATNVAFRWNETSDKWQFTNDGSSYIDLGESDLVGDTTPQLGGDLDLNSNNITGTGNINITGALTASTSVKGNQLTINAASPPADPSSGEAFIYASKSSGATGIRIHASSFTSEVLEVRMGNSSTDLMKLNNQGNATFQGEVSASYFVDRNSTSHFLDPGSTTTSMAVAGKIGVGTTSPDEMLQVIGSVDIGPNTIPWARTTSSDYNSLSVSGNNSSGSGFLYLGSGATTTNADFDLYRIYGQNGATQVSQISTATNTGANDDGRLEFYTKSTGASLSNSMTIEADGRITSEGRGLTIDNSDATWHAINIAESIDNRVAFRISPTRQGHTQGISMGAIGTASSATGLQAYDTSNTTANDFLINPWGGRVSVGAGGNITAKFTVNKPATGHTTGYQEDIAQLYTTNSTYLGRHYTNFFHDNNNRDGTTDHTVWGLAFGYDNNTRGGLQYDHKGDERMTLWSSYGEITFAMATNQTTAKAHQSDIKMRITNAGNLGVGITSPGTSIHMKDAITNPNTISSNMTIPASSNSMMAGPITLNATVTIPSGSSWTIV